MAACDSSEELFFADIANGVVRSVDLRSFKLDARDVFRCPDNEFLESVAYSAHTDTLLICTTQLEQSHKHSVRSFARHTDNDSDSDSESEWRECHCIKVQLRTRGVLRALSDGRLALANDFGGELQVFAVDSSRALQRRASVKIPAE